MKKLLSLFLLIFPIAAFAQVGGQQSATLSNPYGGNLTASSANCSVAQSCAWVKLPATATTTTITITGTFSATLQIETSADGGNTFTNSSTQTAPAVVTITTTSLTDVRVRCSVYTSGSAGVNIQTAGNQLNVTIGSSSGGGGAGFSKVTSGLIGEYKLTEGTGTTINDASSVSGAGTFGSGLGAPLWTVASQYDPFATPSAAGVSLGVFWTIATGTIQKINVSGTQDAFISAVDGSQNAAAMYNTGTFSNNQFASATQSQATPITTKGLGPAIRVSVAAVGTYSLYACYGDATTMYLLKVINGTRTNLTTTPRVTNLGDVTTISATVSNLTCTMTTTSGVVTTLTATDSTVTNGNPGLFGTVVSGGNQVNNFFAGNSAAPNTGGLWFYGNQFVTMPAALNSAQTIQVYSCYQRASNVNLYNALMQGNGAGAASNANGLVITGQVNLNNGPITQLLPHLSLLGNSSYGMTPYSNFNGCGVATATFGSSSTNTFDSTWINGVQSIYTNNAQTQSAGLQTTGAYQLGGAAANSGFGTASFLTGAIYYVLAYNRVLTSSEIQQNSNFLQETMNSRGVPSFLGDTQRGDICITSGDSITNGFGVANGLVWTQNLSFFTPANGTQFLGTGTGCWNQGVTATTMKQLDSVLPITDAPLFSTSARNVDVVWAGTNDMQPPTSSTLLSYSGTAGQVLQSMKHYSDQLRAPNGLGVKVITVSMLSRTGGSGDANKDAFNPLLRNWWASFADGLVDLGETATLGADGASATGAFQDGIHPTAGSQLNVISPLIERSINRIYGNNDFSSATTYGSAAASAVATTAGSETSHTVTLTFGATPANCQIGNIITVAGTTPAGYSGNWMILTRSATQVTYYEDTTGLGAISVQGTGVCPQQQDQDVYQILNFGAGNYTLETCDAMTGQNIYIKNINAVASTIVPFGAQTIDGAANLSIAQNVVHILQSQLVSNTAGGCTWKVLQ